MKKASLLKCLVLCLLFLRHQPLQAQDMEDTLDSRQRSIVIVSALTATGGVEQLAPQLHAALDAGLTINEIKEALTQLYAYCGFPRSLNSISQFMAVLEERKSKGIRDVEGRAIAMNAGNTDKYEQGRKVLEELT